MDLAKKWFTVLLMNSMLFNFVTLDVFTAVCKLEKLVEEESLMVKALESYIDQSKESGYSVQDSVFKFLTEVKLKSEESLKPGFVENPINSFRLIRRVFYDWTQVLDDINCEDCIETQATKKLTSSIGVIKDTSSVGPVTLSDCEGAALALIRLWQTYKLDLQELFSGTIKKQQTGSLSESEIIYILQVAEDKKMYYQEIIWLDALYRLLVKSATPSDSPKTPGKICRMLAKAYNLNAMPMESVRVLKSHLERNPGDKRVQHDLTFYENTLKTMTTNMKKTTLQPGKEDQEKAHYEALCRGDVKRPASIESKLKCYTRKTVIPIYFTKEEVLNVDPRLSMFYDVVTANEQTFLKNTVFTKLYRSQIAVDGSTTVSTYDDGRISQTAFLSDWADPLIKRMSDRVQLNTGLSTGPYHAENMQVVNYGIGGMYEEHADWFNDTATWLQTTTRTKAFYGDRLATWLFYLNDVEAGGATVFLKMNVTVPVVKGAAAFWYNLKRNGDVDERTWHGGCPILQGSKWSECKHFIQQVSSQI